MRSSLQQLQDRTQCSCQLLEEAAAERNKTQLTIEEYDNKQVEYRRLYVMYGPHAAAEFQSYEDQTREEQEYEDARDKLKSDEEYVDQRPVT